MKPLSQIAAVVSLLIMSHKAVLSSNQMALFNLEESNIWRHIINVFKEGELPKDNNVLFLHVNGVKKQDSYSCFICS